MNPEAEKVCARCKETWPATKEFFYGDRNQPGGLRRICKACYHETPCIIRRAAARKRHIHSEVA